MPADNEFVNFLGKQYNLINLVVYAYLYCASSFNYYLITFYLKYLPGNIFQNMMVASLAEFTASLAIGFVVRKLGHKNAFTATFGFFTISSLCLALAIQFEAAELMPVILMVAKLTSTGAIATVYMSSLVFFPNQFLGTVFGICGSSAKFVTIFSPMVAESPEPTASATMILSGALATFLSVWLCESKDEFK